MIPIKEIFHNIISAFQLGTLLSEPFVIRENRVWKIITDKGQFKIKRILYHEFLQAQQGDRIACAFKQKDILAETALCFSESPIFSIEENHFMIFEWREGLVAPQFASSVKNAYKIGVLLARIHSLNLQLPDITSSRWQNFIVPDWNQLLKEAREKKMTYANLLERSLPELIQWSELYENARAKIGNTMVISHADLLPSNVVWSAQEPFLIDWEAAGYIHPQLELWNAAINWSGITEGNIRSELFVNILEGYRSLKMPVILDENIVYTGLGSWLSWLVYRIQQSLISREYINIQPDIEVMRRIVKNFREIISLQ